MFANKNEVALKNPLDSSSALYSFLDKMDMIQTPGEPYHFKLCYPELTQHSEPCNEWTQTQNPMGGSVVTDAQFKAISTVFPKSGNSNHNFRGLAKNRGGKDTNTIIDAAPQSNSWWFAIGALKLHGSNLPGPHGELVSLVELYLKRPLPTPGIHI